MSHRPSALDRRPNSFTQLAIIALLAVGCGKLSLTGPEAAKAHNDDEPPMIAVTLVVENLELFMEHPYLVQGQEAKFNVHLTVLADGMPIRSGKLTVVAKGPTGKTAQVEQLAPRSPGIFGPVIAFPEPGENELSLILNSEQVRQTIRVPVMVYADRASATKVAEDAGEEEPDGAIRFLKEQAWKVGVVHEPVEKRQLVERLSVPGQIVPAAGAKAVVTPPLSGRVLPPSGAFPRVGQQVSAGDIVAVIEPPLAGPQGVELLVNRAQIQALETELAVKQMDVEIEVSKAKLELEYVQQVHKRAEALSAQGATSKKLAEEALHELRLAEAAYAGKLRRLEPYEEARRKLRSLIEGRESRAVEGQRKVEGQGPSNEGQNSPALGSGPSTLSFPLRAPVSGTVTAAHATEGEFVDATRSLFTIINLDRVWIEAKVSEYDLDRVTKAPGATFTLGAYPDRTFTIIGRTGGQLIDVGSVVDPASRTVPVRYEVPNPDRLLRAGMFADVAIETARTEQVLAIRDSAIVDEDGRPTAYVLLDGESFQKRDLVLGIRDAGFVEVKQGLKAGERVVTKGAYAIRLASVSSVIPAHGHAH